MFYYNINYKKVNPKPQKNTNVSRETLVKTATAGF